MGIQVVCHLVCHPVQRIDVEAGQADDDRVVDRRPVAETLHLRGEVRVARTHELLDAADDRVDGLPLERIGDQEGIGRIRIGRVQAQHEARTAVANKGQPVTYGPVAL